jgi:hypothetical protein
VGICSARMRQFGVKLCAIILASHVRTG